MEFETSTRPYESVAPDPLADLLFTLIAAVLPAILMLAPLLERSNRIVTQSRDAAPPAVTVDGIDTDPLVAGPEGLRLTGEEARTIGLDQIPVDAGLRRKLLGMRNAGTPLLLVIEPDGLEAAFTFEPVAAAFGPATISQVRAAESCRASHDRALRATCRLPS